MSDADKTEKILGYLGLAAKAGKAIAGVPLIRAALSRGRGDKPLLIVRASDSAENSTVRVENCAAFYGVPLLVVEASTERLARAVGKRNAAVAAVGVCDEHLAKAILQLQKTDISI